MVCALRRSRWPLLLGLMSCLVACRPPTFDFNLRAERVVVSDGWLAMGTFFDADLRVPPSRVEEIRDWLERQRDGDHPTRGDLLAPRSRE